MGSGKRIFAELTDDYIELEFDEDIVTDGDRNVNKRKRTDKYPTYTDRNRRIVKQWYKWKTMIKNGQLKPVGCTIKFQIEDNE